MKEILKNKWIKLLGKTLFIILIIIIILLIITFLILNFYPPLGGKITKQDEENYSTRATNYKNGLFTNENDIIFIDNNAKPNTYISTKGETPKETIKSEKPTLLDDPQEEDLTITWFGHSTILIQMSGLNILIDPVFSDYASPVQLLGPKRFSELPMTIEELPHIDLVLITHDHYDHLDYNSIKKLKDKTDKFIVPLGVEKHLLKWKVDEDKIENMAWWEETTIGTLTIACTPAKHYSNRSINDRFKTLWASYVLKNNNYQIFQSGDTGYDKHFEEIYKKYGEFDLALLDSGQYNTMWPEVHMTPEESVQASIDLHAKVRMPIHWATFQLSSHPWDETPERFTKKSQEENVTSITPKIGQTVNYNNYNEYINNNWWKDIE